MSDDLIEITCQERNADQRPASCPFKHIANRQFLPCAQGCCTMLLYGIQISGAPGQPGQISLCSTHVIRHLYRCSREKAALSITLNLLNISALAGYERQVGETTHHERKIGSLFG